MHNDKADSITGKAGLRGAFAAMAIAVALTVAFALSGCTIPTTSSSEEEEQTLTPAEYMVRLNQAATSLRDGLDELATAITDGDLSTLQSKSDAAFEAMEALDDLKTPDELTDIKSKYKEAADTLHSSLNDYIALYIDIQSNPNPSDITQKDYSESFENIQKEYDRGLNLLDQADSAAKEI